MTDSINNELVVHFEDFIREQKYTRGARSETIKGYIAAFKLFMKLVPEANLQMIQNRTTWIGFFEALNTRTRFVGKGDIKTGVKNSTLLTYRSKLDVFMRWLSDTGHIKTNPLPSIQKPHVVYTDRCYLTKTEIERLFRVCEYSHEWANQFLRIRNMTILKMVIYTGVRRGELLGLRVQDVNLFNGSITVEAQTSKSKKRRTIPLSRHMIIDLKTYLRERKLHPISYTTDALFTSSVKDSALTKHGLKHFVDLLKKESGVNFYLHRGRHTFAANMNAKGVPLSHLQQLMGHIDPRMTLTYGRETALDTLRESMEKFGKNDLI